MGVFEMIKFMFVIIFYFDNEYELAFFSFNWLVNDLLSSKFFFTLTNSILDTYTIYYHQLESKN